MQETSCDIILFALFRWDSPYSSISIAMAKEFAKSHRIFYVNHPYSIKDYFNELSEHPERKSDLRSGKVRYEKDPKMPDRFTSVIPPVTLPINTLPKGVVYDFFANFNHRKLQKTIRQIVEDHDLKQYIYINCFDPFYSPVLPKDIRPLVNIYQSVDDISQNDYTAKHGTKLEQKAIEHADLTMVTSRELYRLKSKWTKHIHILNNAADISSFKRALDIDFPKPEALQNIEGDIIGYIGNLDELRVDYPLLKKVALTYPDKTLVLVGPINNTIYKEIGLDQLPNVLFTGGMSIEALPPYLRYFDCAVIPFMCNTLTKSIYPLKINEYLAAGKAVVATNFSPDIESFREHIFLADSETQFVEMIGEAVLSNHQEKINERLNAAKNNTWKARIEQFWDIVNPYLPENVGPQAHCPVVKTTQKGIQTIAIPQSTKTSD